MTDKQYTAAEMRAAFLAGRVGNDVDSTPCHCKECEEILRDIVAEALRRYPDKEDKREPQ